MNPLLPGSCAPLLFCLGKPDCTRALGESTPLSLELDKAFGGQEVPAKLRIGVSGCSEVFVKDIGLYATVKGCRLIVGDNSDRKAQVGRIIAEVLPHDKVTPAIRLLLDYPSQAR